MTLQLIATRSELTRSLQKVSVCVDELASAEYTPKNSAPFRAQLYMATDMGYRHFDSAAPRTRSELARQLKKVAVCFDKLVSADYTPSNSAPLRSQQRMDLNRFPALD